MMICASDAGNGNGGKAVAGAWMLMVEVSMQDPAAPSWEFLQVTSGYLLMTVQYQSIVALIHAH